MLTVEIKVNGQLIGHCYCHDISPPSEIQTVYPPITVSTECEYDVIYYRVGNKKTKQFKIVHNQSDGAEVLVRKIFECLT